MFRTYRNDCVVALPYPIVTHYYVAAHRIAWSVGTDRRNFQGRASIAASRGKNVNFTLMRQRCPSLTAKMRTMRNAGTTESYQINRAETKLNTHPPHPTVCPMTFSDP